MKPLRIVTAAASLFLLAAILLSIVDLMCFARPFYSYEYKKGNQAEKIGMSDEGLMEATDALLDYLREKRDDIVVITEVNGSEREVYNERETLHMKDVRNLYQGAVTARNIMAAVSLILFAAVYMVKKKSASEIIYEGWKRGIVLLLLFISFTAIWAAVDFDEFWLQFHYIFFDNNLFLLDPNTSIMINMFPSSFFFDIVICIIVLTVLASGIITFILKKISSGKLETI